MKIHVFWIMVVILSLVWLISTSGLAQIRYKHYTDSIRAERGHYSYKLTAEELRSARWAAARAFVVWGLVVLTAELLFTWWILLIEYERMMGR